MATVRPVSAQGLRSRLPLAAVAETTLAPVGTMTRPRHLRYDVAPVVLAGLAHHEANLKCLLREAHAAGRLAVLPPLTLHPKHNFGRDRDWRWADYYDFAASRLVDLAGREHPLPIAFAPENAAEPLRLRAGERIPPAREDHPYVIRRLENALFKHEVPSACRPDFAITLRLSAPLRALAKEALAGLASRSADGFVGMHVRRGDRLGEYPSELTEPPHIKKCLARHGVPQGGLIYLCSDERDPNFWAPLERCFQVVRHVDFPRLASLVAEPLPDNYALYQVEREILAHGRLWIDTLPKGNPHVHGVLVQASDFQRISAKKTVDKLRRAVNAKFARLFARGVPARKARLETRRSPALAGTPATGFDDS